MEMTNTVLANAGLHPAEYNLLSERFGLSGTRTPVSVREAARNRGMDEADLRRVEIRALRKLRQSLGT